MCLLKINVALDHPLVSALPEYLKSQLKKLLSDLPRGYESMTPKKLFSELNLSESLRRGKFRILLPIQDSARIEDNQESKNNAFTLGMAKIQQKGTFSCSFLNEFSFKYANIRYSQKRRIWYLNLVFAYSLRRDEKTLGFEKFWKSVETWRYSSTRVFTLSELTVLLDFPYKSVELHNVLGQNSHLILTKNDNGNAYITCNTFIARKGEKIEYPSSRKVSYIPIRLAVAI